MFLYRYNRLSDRTITYLTDRNLYFCNPINFNDPFDCNLNCLDINTSDSIDNKFEQYTNFLKERIEFINRFITHYSVRIKDNDNPVGKRYYYGDISDLYLNEIRNLAEELHVLHSCPREKLHQAITESWEIKKTNVINSLGVLCFSSTNSNILLWSHYADNHKGICFQYDSTVRPVKNWKKFKFHKVLYRNERNIDVLNRGFTNSFFDLLTTKSTDWEYEQEYRLISIKGPGLQKNTMKSLTGIIFGARIKENPSRQLELLYQSLCNMDKQRRSVKKLKYYLAVKDNHKFAINIEELQDLKKVKLHIGL